MITREMSITEVVQNHPETVSVFMQYGMHCIGCAAARFENIGEGALAHGINVEALIEDLNKVVNN